MHPSLLIKGCPAGSDTADPGWLSPWLPPDASQGHAPLAETGTWDDPCARLITARDRKLLADSALFEVENILISLPPLTRMTGVYSLGRKALCV